MKIRYILLTIFVIFLPFVSVSTNPLPVSHTIRVDAAGGGDYTSIQTAVNVANDGDTILVAAGRYIEQVTLYPKQDISIIGAGTGAYVEATGELTGGTIIEGIVSLFDSVGSSLSNLGIDVHALNYNAVDTGSLVPYEQHVLNQRFINLLLSGNASISGNDAHGIRIQGGSHITIDNVQVYHFAHGIAVRGSWVTISNIYAEDCYDSAIIVKGADTTGNAEFVNISNVLVKNMMGTSGGGIVIQSYSDGFYTRFVNVSNAVIDGAAAPAIWIEQHGGLGVIEHINISNVVATNNKSWTSVFYLNNANYVTLSSCQAISPLHEYYIAAFRNDGGAHVQIIGGIVYPSTLTVMGAWDYVQIN